MVEGHQIRELRTELAALTPHGMAARAPQLVAVEQPASPDPTPTLDLGNHPHPLRRPGPVGTQPTCRPSSVNACSESLEALIPSDGSVSAWFSAAVRGRVRSVSVRRSESSRLPSTSIRRRDAASWSCTTWYPGRIVSNRSPGETWRPASKVTRETRSFAADRSTGRSNDTLHSAGDALHAATATGCAGSTRRTRYRWPPPPGPLPQSGCPPCVAMTRSPRGETVVSTTND